MANPGPIRGSYATNEALSVLIIESLFLEASQ